MRVTFSGFDYKATFKKDYKRAPENIRGAVGNALRGLLKTPIPSKLRLHSITGCFDEKVFKVDVTPNHAWQITFEMNGTIAVLRRLARHKDIDRAP